MFDGARLRCLMADRGLSQSELARRVGISQASVYRLVAGDAYGSKHLHRIARELGTTPAYLVGETNDPDLNAPLPAPPGPQIVMLGVVLPPERALAQMFEGLLETMDRSAPVEEQAQLLAERLPIGLSQLRDLLPDRPRPPPPREPAPAAAAEALATSDRESP